MVTSRTTVVWRDRLICDSNFRSFWVGTCRINLITAGQFIRLGSYTAKKNDTCPSWTVISHQFRLLIVHSESHITFCTSLYAFPVQVMLELRPLNSHFGGVALGFLPVIYNGISWLQLWGTLLFPFIPMRPHFQNNHIGTTNGSGPCDNYLRDNIYNIYKIFPFYLYYSVYSSF